MDNYNKTLNSITKIYIEKDEKDRKTKNLSTRRSDIEALEYRNQFDNFYESITNDLINAIKTDFGKLPDSPSASSFMYGIDKTRYHDFLNDTLVLPHALSKVLDYQTNSRGKNTDIAKILNLFALTMTTVAKSAGVVDGTQMNFVGAFTNLLNGLKRFNLQEAPFSEIGIDVSVFIYWLIYDSNKKELNLNMLIDLAEATKGSFNDFKTFIVAFWLVRSSNPDTAVNFFYNSILPNI